MKKIFIFFLVMGFSFSLFSQEVLKSSEEEYYSMLSLTGNIQRNYLIYRTLSDSVWNFQKETDSSNLNIWDGKALNTRFTLWQSDKDFSDNWFLRGIPMNVTIKPYGVEWLNSYNTRAPFGQNDGALWQGRGYNTYATGGLRVEGFGFELTLKPQFSFSQNLEFEIMPSSWGNGYGYFWGNCDAPQRFGSESFNTWEWGDSEVRWSWKNFTIGYGTQAVWLGPNMINPLLLSNNAATFPKFDVGLRKTKVVIPFVDYYLGDIEARLMLGKLTESDYFDEDDTNDERAYILYSLSFAPSFLPGFTMGANKVCIADLGDDFIIYYLNPFYHGNRLGADGEDQKASITADWLLPKSQIEFYTEIGIDDYPSKGLSFYEYARYPFHTMSYTVGVKRLFDIGKEKPLKGLVNFEWNCTEPSQDYQIWGNYYSFGHHHQLKQGYTNRGQWLGSGIGYGGNSQYLSFTLYSPHGYDKLFIARNNPDNSYIYGKATTSLNNTVIAAKYYTAYKANFYTGYETLWFIQKNFSVKGSFTYNLIINPLYNPGYSGDTKDGIEVFREYNYWHNLNFTLTGKFTL